MLTFWGNFYVLRLLAYCIRKSLANFNYNKTRAKSLPLPLIIAKKRRRKISTRKENFECEQSQNNKITLVFVKYSDHVSLIMHLSASVYLYLISDSLIGMVSDPVVTPHRCGVTSCGMLTTKNLKHLSLTADQVKDTNACKL